MTLYSSGTVTTDSILAQLPNDSDYDGLDVALDDFAKACDAFMQLTNTSHACGDN